MLNGDYKLSIDQLKTEYPELPFNSFSTYTYKGIDYTVETLLTMKNTSHIDTFVDSLKPNLNRAATKADK